MATIAELAQMSVDAYQGPPSATGSTNNPLLTGLTGWEVIATSNPQFLNNNYFGVAYYNTITHEVVIANRGTDPSWTQHSLVNNAQTDEGIVLQQSNLAEADAAAFAAQVVADLNDAHKPYTSVIETGHSLGGADAQFALARLVDSGVLPNSQASAVCSMRRGYQAEISSPPPRATM